MSEPTPWDPHEHDIPETPTISEGTGYSSPLISHMSQQRLTLPFLQEQIPIVRRGEAAQERLDKSHNRMKDATKHALRQEIQAGQDAKERLFAAALPLIRTIASREWRRRRQWGSQVSLDDLTQEAIVGFLKGISGFNLDAAGRSGTNYLGQWMLVETRRAAESLDHDLQVGHDAGERFRRIRALRGRLRDELGREPTDEEISEASRDLSYVTRPGLVGKAPKEGETRKPGKGVTDQQVAEERRYRSRLGASDRFDEYDTDSDNAGHVVDIARAQPITSTQPISPEETVTESYRGLAIADILHRTLSSMDLPDLQNEIIARRHGLPPFTGETSAREVSRLLGVQRDRVSRILTAFQEELLRPGGALHAQLRMLTSDDIDGLEVEWLTSTLGDWPAGAQFTPADLPTVLRSDSEPTKPPAVEHTSTEITVTFHCEFHDRNFSAVFPTRRHAPRTRPCPACQTPSPRVAIAAGPTASHP